MINTRNGQHLSTMNLLFDVYNDLCYSYCVPCCARDVPHNFLSQRLKVRDAVYWCKVEVAKAKRLIISEPPFLSKGSKKRVHTTPCREQKTASGLKAGRRFFVFSG